MLGRRSKQATSLDADIKRHALNRPGLTESKILQEKEVMKTQIRYS